MSFFPRRHGQQRPVLSVPEECLFQLSHGSQPIRDKLPTVRQAPQRPKVDYLKGGRSQIPPTMICRKATMAPTANGAVKAITAKVKLAGLWLEKRENLNRIGNW